MPILIKVVVLVIVAVGGFLMGGLLAALGLTVKDKVGGE